jgi:cyclohexa-1,5-dienecarbonyl-CoA hydratase
MSAGSIYVRTEGQTARITLARPPLNVIDIEMMREISVGLAQVLPSAKILVFEGAGEQGFSSGGEIRDQTPERVAEMVRAFHRIFRQLWKADCVTIAAVHGHCLGSGCELATFCDFVVADTSAQFGQPEIKYGFFPPVAMVTLPRLIGPRAAADLILTGRTLNAGEALDLGLITRIVPKGGLAAGVSWLLSELDALSPAVVRMSRRALWRATGFDFEAMLQEVEDVYLDQLMKTKDAKEGVRAMIEKRAPVWEGR